MQLQSSNAIRQLFNSLPFETLQSTPSLNNPRMASSIQIISTYPFD
jgi:hypothetical protein